MKNQFLTFLRTIIFSLFAVGRARASSQVLITEVYVYGTDEYIELSNFGSEAFVGDITLTQVKSSQKDLKDLSVNIPPNHSILIANTPDLFDGDVDIIGQQALSLTDSKAIDIRLLHDEQVLDSFFVATGEVTTHNGGPSGVRPSFHKYYTNGNRTIDVSREENSLGILTSSQGTKYGNPGIVFALIAGERTPLSGHIDEANSPEDDDSGSSPDDDDNDDTGALCDLPGALRISELYHGDDFADYIELYVDSSWEQGVILSGTALSYALHIDRTQRLQNNYYLITASQNGLHHSEHIDLDASLSLHKGNLLLMTMDGQLLSSYTISDLDEAGYPSTTDNCNYIINSGRSPSPGFDEQFLAYLDKQVLVHTEIVEIEMCTDDPSDPTDPTDPEDETPGDSDTAEPPIGTGSTRGSGVLRISLLDYDPPGTDTDNERVGLTLLSGDLVHLNAWTLRYNDDFKKVYHFPALTISSGEELIISDNFQMLNSRPVCVQLLDPDEILVDTACYDPALHPSPYYPLKPVLDYSKLQFTILDVDPSDTDHQRVRIRFDTGYDAALDLSKFRLRVGTVNKTISGRISPGEILTLIGRFAIPKTVEREIAFVFGEIIYDSYLSSPPPKTQTPKPEQEPLTDDSDYLSLGFTILGVDYSGPSGGDQDITIHYDTGDTAVDLSKLKILVNGVNKPVTGIISPGETKTLSRKFNLLKTKTTCVELRYASHRYDSYCYDPTDKPIEVVLSGEVVTSNRSGLHLQRILPNPKGKDIVGENELVALYRSGQSRQVMDKSLKLKFGTANMSLSGLELLPGENVFSATKAIPNGPSCVQLIQDNTLLDEICYPQAPDDTRYYHPRLNRGPATLPQELMESLAFDLTTLNKIQIKNIDKKACLLYDNVQIRCINAQQTATSKKNQALLTLANAYIRQFHTMYYANQLYPQFLLPRMQSYTQLSQRIKANQLAGSRYRGTLIKPTELERYINLSYKQPSKEYLIDEVGGSLLGMTFMGDLYTSVYNR